jgi:uncharacterized repeat protein (TIGR03803 family)
LVQGTDGNFYGTTKGGGVYLNCSGAGCGTVFKITAEGMLTVLHSFCALGDSCADGDTPWAGLVQATDGNFYGTTQGGGPYYCGTVFKMTPAGALTTLHSFDCSDGSNPVAGLVQATDGNFYSTTWVGGAGGYGTVFKMIPNGTLTTLYSFCTQSGCQDGAYPEAGLVQGTDGDFYGATGAGGAFRIGTIFKVTRSGTLTTLHSFDDSDGVGPSAGLIQGRDGNFYGTTPQGGAYYSGTVFRIGVVRRCAACRP